MEWDKIDAHAVMKVLRAIDEGSLTIKDKKKMVYSDGKEELTITYRRISE